MNETIASPAAVERARPTAGRTRSLAPDVARGFMLLFIALANTTVLLYGSPDGLLFRPLDASGADRIVDAIGALFIDNRAFPMFAFLFAYGIHQLTTREQARGATWPQTRGLLVRRNLWLLAIGVAHAVLLFYGDIIVTYALCGLLLVLLVRAPGWVLWLVFGVSMLLFVPLGAADTIMAAGFTDPVDSAIPFFTLPSFVEAYWAQLVTGLGMAVGSPLTAVAMLPPMMLGVLAARLRLLERPWEHAVLLRVVSFGGLAVGVLGGLPIALALLNGFEPHWQWALWGIVHGVTGLAAGPAMACLIALLVSRFERRRADDPSRRPGVVARALSALGRRSLSAYVAQSVAWFVLFPAWSFGLGGMLGTAGAAVVAVGVWVATLIGANVLEALGTPGPLEWVLRRLAYGRPRDAVDRS